MKEDIKKQLENEISALPKGYISQKNINGSTCYYRQWRESGRIKSEYVPRENVDYLINQISERKQLEAQLRLECYRNPSDSRGRQRLREYAKKFYMECNVPIGVQDYEYLISNKCFYIDKTLFIKEFWERDDSVTLITRPRRFGKTLNMRMLECFFSNQYEGRADLFEGFDIWKYEKYRNLQGTWPVIFLSFGMVKGDSIRALKYQICSQINLYLHNLYYLEEQGLFNEDELRQYRLYKEALTDIDLAISAIPFICSVFYRIYGRKTIILLDEYDTPLIEAHSLGIWKECSGFMRSLLNSLFKTNQYLHRGLLTGITRISKESFFSDLNNLEVVSVTSPKYATFFGFTEEEVFKAMDLRGMPDKDLVREWYNGFHFGNRRDIYNPWSIINYLEKHEFKPYWVHSSSNVLISDLFQKGDKRDKQYLERLLAGETVSVSINDEITLMDLDRTTNAVWSLLVSVGYLKITDTDEKGVSTLTVTNREVSIMLDDMVRGWFENTDYYNDFLSALLENNEYFLNKTMNSILENVSSYFDTSGKEPERFYHGLVLGLMLDLKDDFIITSNRESGLGRYDVMLEPRDCEKNCAYILEFKVKRGNTEESLLSSAMEAIDQINRKKYDTVLASRGIPADKICKYGFAFEGKEACIKMG